MDILVPIIAIIMVFLPAVIGVKRSFDLKEKKLQAGGSKKELEALREERKLLQARVENLESIVCSVDFELNQKIQRLLSDSGAALRLASGQGQPVEVGQKERETVAAKASASAAVGTAPTVALVADRPKSAGQAAAATPGELFPGSVLAGRYHVKRLIGRGGMGAVYLADDETLGEVCALKVISSAWSHDPEAATDRFRREAQAARKISSPNVIRIHDLGEAPGGLLYISMEYFAGKSLGELLSARGVMPIGEATDILRQVAAGLSAAHQVGVVHRDLKPQNVLVGERSAVKIIDFGLAKASFLAGMTATGLILGTPEYMAPEQVRGKPIDARTDIYALGALAYHVLCGRPPFVGETPIAVGFAHVSETPRPPRELRPEMSEALEKVILAALAKDPGGRPASADAIAAAL